MPTTSAVAAIWDAAAGSVPLTDPDLWGRHIGDERYAVIATR